MDAATRLLSPALWSLWGVALVAAVNLQASEQDLAAAHRTRTCGKDLKAAIKTAAARAAPKA